LSETSEKLTSRHRISGRLRRLASGLAALCLASATMALLPPSASAAAGSYGETVADEGFTAQIRRTEYGIPHILAHDYSGLGYGYGYAFAQDNLCELADQVVTLRGERSRYFGPSGTPSSDASGTSNLVSDTYYQGLRQAGTVQRLLGRRAPVGPTPQLRKLVDGYAAGYNRYLRDTGVAGLPDPTCKGKPWVGPITALDIWSIVYDVNETYFTDGSVVPHLTDDQLRRCSLPGGDDQPDALDGSASACDWGSDPDAVVPGTYGPANQPELTRTDYVANSNNGPYLTNPAAPITGLPGVYNTGTRLGQRAQLGLRMIEQRRDGTDGLGTPGFTLPTLQATMFGDRNYSAELGRADVVAMCRAHPELTAGVDDVADLYVLALNAPAGSACAGAGGQNLPPADVTRALSHAAGCANRIESLPVEEAVRRMGPSAEAFALDQQFSGARARRELGWTPTRLDALAELGRPAA
jgi:hypothetical protein